MLVCRACRRGDRIKTQLHNGGHHDATGSVPPLNVERKRLGAYVAANPRTTHREQALVGRIS